jgi:hypothetical protein
LWDRLAGHKGKILFKKHLKSKRAGGMAAVVEGTAWQAQDPEFKPQKGNEEGQVPSK